MVVAWGLPLLRMIEYRVNDMDIIVNRTDVTCRISVASIYPSTWR